MTSTRRLPDGWDIRHLPDTPQAFLRAFILRHPVAYSGMLALQTFAMVCAVLVPWQLGQITRLVSQGLDASQVVTALRWPLAGFALMLLLEMVSTRAASGLHIYTVPRQRRAVTQALLIRPAWRRALIVCSSSVSVRSTTGLTPCAA